MRAPLACLAACLASAVAADESKPPAVEAEAAAASNRFAFKLYAELLERSEGKNLFVSPLSVSTALSMTLNGAAGSTREAMLEALELKGVPLDQVNQGNLALATALEKADPAVTLSVANSLWARKGVAFQEGFLKRTGEDYKAKLTALDFADPKAKDVINGWVNDATKGKIPEIVERIEPDAALFLINAVYFKGAWSRPFEKGKTKPGTFTRADGSKKDLPMMTQSGDYGYATGDGFQAVSLPYGKGRLRMLLFLPDEGVSLQDLHRCLKPRFWKLWLESFSEREGELVLPRFRMEYGASLNDALAALGMGPAFSAAADFSEMIAGERLQVSEVNHKAFLEVNEEGAEAAAATEVGISFGAEPPPPFKLRFDRPFFAAIVDGETGAILFMGSVVDPR